MDKAVSGTITCEKIPLNRVLRRFVERRIADWLESQPPGARAASGPEGGAEFRVLFEREGADGLVGCHAEIRSGPETWLGSAIASGPQQALLRCLSRMRLDRTRAIRAS